MMTSFAAGSRTNLCALFFSSRRRHTRLQGDWSSDVCSSDLEKSETSMRSFHLLPVSSTVSIPDSVSAPAPVKPVLSKIGRASCRERGEDLGGRRHVETKSEIDGIDNEKGGGEDKN